MSSDDFGLKTDLFLGYCDCRFGFYPDATGSQYSTFRGHGQECRSNRQCQQHDMKAICQPKGNGFLVCACLPEFRYNASMGQCEPTLDAAGHRTLATNTVLNCSFHHWDHVRKECRDPVQFKEDRDHVLSIVMAILCITCFFSTCIFVCCFTPTSKVICFKSYSHARRARTAMAPGAITTTPVARRAGRAARTSDSTVTVSMYSTIPSARRPVHGNTDRLGDAARTLAPMRIEGQAVPDQETLFWLKMISVNAQSKRLSCNPPSYDEVVTGSFPQTPLSLSNST